ncbi:MAG: nucleotidyltransferase domain-containing protein, partial [Nitrospirae bacterium]
MLRTEIEGLEILSERLKTALGTNIRAIVAFGSRVRGDFNWESDFDVLVVVE